MEKKFQRRVTLSLIALLITFLPLIAAAFFSIREMINDQNELVVKNMHDVQLAEKLRHANSVQDAALPAYILSGDAGLIDVFQNASKEFNGVLKQLIAIEDVPEAQEILHTVLQNADLLNALAGPGIRMRVRGEPLEKVHNYFKKETPAISKNLRETLDKLVSEETRELEEARHHVADTIDGIIKGLISVSLAVLFLALVIVALIMKLLRQQRIHEERQRELFDHEKRVSQSRKEIVEVVSHDLKNPLSTIKMGVSLTLEELSDRGIRGEITDGLNIAYRSAESMERLIKDLLDHAKIESGQLVLEQRECNLDGLLEDLYIRYGSLARLKGVSLVEEIQDKLPSVSCDQGRMEQALSNLLGNALKFTPAGGRITLRVSARAREIAISIQDTGSGMKQEELPHIFDRFWQVRETARQGTGLGLSIVKSIVDAHLGRVEVKSEVGVGTTFTVYLPAVGAQKVVPFRSETRMVEAQH